RPTICWATPTESSAAWHRVIDAAGAAVKMPFRDHAFGPSMLVGTFVGHESITASLAHAFANSQIDLPVLFFVGTGTSLTATRVNKVVNAECGTNEPAHCTENLYYPIHKLQVEEEVLPNGGVDAAARIQTSIAGPVM